MFYRSHPWLSVRCYLYQRYDGRFSKYVVVCIMTNNIQSTVGCSDLMHLRLECKNITLYFCIDKILREPQMARVNSIYASHGSGSR